MSSHIQSCSWKKTTAPSIPWSASIPTASPLLRQEHGMLGAVVSQTYLSPGAGGHRLLHPVAAGTGLQLWAQCQTQLQPHNIATQRLCNRLVFFSSVLDAQVGLAALGTACREQRAPDKPFWLSDNPESAAAAAGPAQRRPGWRHRLS